MTTVRRSPITAKTLLVEWSFSGFCLSLMLQYCVHLHCPVAHLEVHVTASQQSLGKTTIAGVIQITVLLS